MRDLYVLGTGGLAKEMAQLAAQINRVTPTWIFKGYIARSINELNCTLPYGRVVGTDEWLLSLHANADVVVGIGHPSMRKEVSRRLNSSDGLRWPNLIHPSVQIDWDVVEMGCGNVITTNCVLTCDVEIGDFNLLNWCVTIGHDTRIGSFNVINPGSNISGHVVLNDEILVGTGSQILENLQVASRTTVGAGAVVISSIATEGGLYAGVPATRRR
jgi:sugar O-acyltransferase (sialic acid O-acetyltransferase NeuD family)